MELRSEFSFATKPSPDPQRCYRPTLDLHRESRMSCPTGHIDIPCAVKGEGTSTISTTSSQKVAARMELRSEFSFATKPSPNPAKVLSADPGPIPGKSAETVVTGYIDIPRAVKGEGKATRQHHFLPERWLPGWSSDLNSASRQSLQQTPAKVLSADPGPTPGKSDETVIPAT